MTEQTNTEFGFRPLRDEIIIKPDAKKEKSAGGIILPDAVEQNVDTGVVVAVGPGKYSVKGDLIPMPVTVGDKVMYSHKAAFNLKLENEEYVVVVEDHVIGVFR